MLGYDEDRINEVVIDIACSIPLIGRKLEGFVAESTDAQLDAEYEFIQEAVNRLRLRIVRRRPVSNEEEARLHSTLMQKLGTEAQLEIEWVKNIAAGESGKFHFCRSLVAANRE